MNGCLSIFSIGALFIWFLLALLFLLGCRLMRVCSAVSIGGLRSSRVIETEDCFLIGVLLFHNISSSCWEHSAWKMR